MKVCTKCHRNQDTRFYRMRNFNNRSSYLNSVCKKCELISNNQRFKKKRFNNRPIPPIDLFGEIWVNIPGYKGYYKASNKGRVKSLAKVISRRGNIKTKSMWEKILKPGDNKGYEKVTLVKEGVQEGWAVHRIVALCFIGKPTKKQQVNHLDGNPRNNILENLEYTTAKGNAEHKYKVLGYKPKHGEQSKLAKLYMITFPNGEKKLIMGIKQFLKDHGLNAGGLFYVLKGIASQHHGYKFRYATKKEYSHFDKKLAA